LSAASAVRGDDDDDDNGDNDDDRGAATREDITTHLLAHALVLAAHVWLLRALC
jgi:hypothetical protein